VKTAPKEEDFRTLSIIEEYNLHSKYIPLDAFSDYVIQLIEQYKECVAVKGDHFEGK
jgi:hypothetical protein